jgi:hypothetical protein
MPAHTRGGDAEPLADLTSGDGPGLQQELENRATRVALAFARSRRSHPRADLRADFPNTIVTEFARAVQEGHPTWLGEIGHSNWPATLLKWQSAALAP